MSVTCVHHTGGAARPVSLDEVVPAGRVGDTTAPPVAAVAQGSPEAVWARAVMAWHRPQLTETEVLQAVVASVLVLVPGAVGAAVLSVPKRGPVHVLASSGEPMNLLTALHRCGDRPGGDDEAWLAGPVGVGRERNGWPIATTHAMVGEGTRIWVPLGQGATMCGTMVIANTGALTDPMECTAVVAAMHASTAVAGARQRDHLRVALDGRDVIGQAKGIVMERLGVSADAAFKLLSQASQRSNVKLRDVCVRVSASGGLDHQAGGSSW